MLDLIEQYENYILPTYIRYPITFVAGSGCRLWDDNGKEYVDFLAGLGVCSIGHANPMWINTITSQIKRLTHVSNLFYTEPQAHLAQRLCEIADMNGAFFANSGAEATEGLIKIARKYSSINYEHERSTILTLSGSFHGRSLAALTATGQEKFHKQYFKPLVPGFRYVDPGNIVTLGSQPNDVCALLIEVIQGESGVRPLTAEYIKSAAEICKVRDWLLLIDEVQTGIGRCGSWFAHQEFGISPDAVSFAKGIAGGLPMGGFLVNKKLKNILFPGDHGTTFGGNLLCSASALATLDILEEHLPDVGQKGEYIRAMIKDMNLPIVTDIRGKGLMIGIEVEGVPLMSVNEKLLLSGLVTGTASKNVIRMLPPLTIEKKDIDEGLEKFETVMKKF